MVNASRINVELVYINPATQLVLELLVPAGITIGEVIQRSGILQQCPEIDLKRNKIGIYSELRKLDDAVAAGDRIEIYRPLQVDPKEARRRRAEKKVNRL